MQKLSKENFYLLLNKYRKMYRNVKVTADACTGCDCDSYCADFSQQNCMSEQCSKKSCLQMDDFGSGYSSLSNLSTLPFSVLRKR